MTQARLPVTLALLLLAVQAHAADLTKIDRTLQREPVYRGQPRYCLLALGPGAAKRVWLVLDDDHLYVDRNGNGDLTEPGERFALSAFKKADATAFAEEREVKVGDLWDGPRTHADLEVTQIHLRKDYVPMDDEERDFLRLAHANGEWLYGISLKVQRPTGSVQQVAFTDARGFLQFAVTTKKAPVVHFGGPLRAELLPLQKLVCGDNPKELQACLGTPGLGKGTLAVLVYATQSGLVPGDVHPVADIEFPGKRPVKTRVVLKERC